MRLKNPSLNIRLTPLLLALVLASYGILSIFNTPKAHATTAFTNAFVRMDHLTALTQTTGRVCIKPSVSMISGDKVILRIPTTAATSYVVGIAGTWTTNTTFESGFTWAGGSPPSALPIASNVASNVTGNDVTFTTNGALTSGTAYCFNWTNSAALKTSSLGAAPSVFGFVKTQATAGSVDKDLDYWGADMISNEVVTVTAIVAPFFTMALNGNTDSFATNLSSGSVNQSNGGRQIQIDTNARLGWIVWVRDANLKTTGITDSGSSPANQHGALTSATAGGYAISNNGSNTIGTASATFTAGSENYGLGTTLFAAGSGAGTATMDPAFDGASNKAGVLDPTQYRPIASSNGTAVAAKLALLMQVTISNSTPPGADYTDTLTYVGAGQF